MTAREFLRDLSTIGRKKLPYFEKRLLRWCSVVRMYIWWFLCPSLYGSYYDGEFYKYLDHIHINPPYFLNSATTDDLIGRGLSFKDNNNISNYHSFRNLAQKRNEFFKVSLCKYFMNGECPFKDKCNFAHGEEELRKYSTKPPQSKTCRSVAASDFLLSISAMKPSKLNCRQQRFLKRNEITQVEKTHQPSDEQHIILLVLPLSPFPYLRRIQHR
jgi:hypothetical protein